MMETQPAYWTEPLTWEFEARITRQTSLGHSQFEIVLETSYFYPTGGGQSYDTGTLGEARVIDVFRTEDGTVVHRVVGDISSPLVIARINSERRLGHMQHHSAQHIVSRALEQHLGLETLSVKISADTPSTIDVPDVEESEAELAQVERLTNYFFRLSRYAKQLEDLIEADQLRIVPSTRRKEVLSFIRAGLLDFSISRSRTRAHNWGIPVPGDPDQVMYVWFDAPFT